MTNYKPRTCKQCERTIPTTKRGTYCSDECKTTARRAQDRARYAKNREDNLKRAREYRQTHKEQCAAATKRWRERNKERISEYLTPLHRGGRHDINNIDFAHRSCNDSKGTKTLEEYRAWQADIQQAS